ncbi:MAG: EAL domain-containing protein [Phycisphaeraceae bacterium]
MRTSSPTAEQALRSCFADCEREAGVFVILGDRVDELRAMVADFTVVDRQSLRACVADEAGRYDPWSSKSIEQVFTRLDSPWFGAVLRDRSLRFQYQPIVDAVTGEVFAHEALMRAFRGDQPISPDALVRSAKAHDALLVLDQACWRAAIEQSEMYLRTGGRVFINFFPITVYDPEVCLATTFAAAERAGADISQLTFEVVESEAFPDIDHLKSILAAYRERGAKVALDDLGSGNTAILFIDQLNPDLIKIDREVLRRAVVTGETSMFIGLIRYAQERGITTIAEGLETLAELDFCRELGVDYVQGYLVGRPSREFMTQPFDPYEDLDAAA